MNGCIDGDNDEGYELGVDYLLVEVFLEVIVVDRCIEYSNGDFYDLYLFVELDFVSK